MQRSEESVENFAILSKMSQFFWISWYIKNSIFFLTIWYNTSISKTIYRYFRYIKSSLVERPQEKHQTCKKSSHRNYQRSLHYFIFA